MDSLRTPTSLEAFQNPKVLSSTLLSYEGYGEVLIKFCATMGLREPVNPAHEDQP